MSFSSEVRKTLCDVDLECSYCSFAELSGIISFTGQLNSDILRFVTEKKYIAKRITDDIYICTGEKAGVFGTTTLKIEISDLDILTKIRNDTALTSQDFEETLENECCRRSYIRGAFLGGGCVLNPDRNYHLEFDTKYKISAERLYNIMSSCGVVPKITYRKGHYLVYLKGSDDIAEVLGLMGASMGALKFYTTQMEKDVRNSINRQINCEVANQKKTSKAASRQLFAIKKIRKKSAMQKLPDVLQEIAVLREKYPDVSLKELGEMLSPPLGKSGVNHRLNRIIEFADGL